MRFQILLLAFVCALASSATYSRDSPIDELDDVLTTVDEFQENGRYTESIELLQPFSEDDDDRVEYYLAIAYMHDAVASESLDTVGDVDKANSYLQRGAELGDDGAKLNLAVMLYTGQGMGRDVERACDHFFSLLDADQANIVAAYYVGVIIFRGQCGQEADAMRAVEIIRIAAEGGHRDSQRDMGKAYEYGWAGETNMAVALDWYNRGAVNGDPQSQWRMGYAFVNGLDYEPDSKRAVEYFRNAARSGHVDGMVSLGVMYATGDGVERDFREARLLYEAAAERGSSTAMKNLGGMYTFGEGVERDRVRGLLLFEQSVALGNTEAVEARDRFRSALSEEELATVKEQLDVWLVENMVE